MGVGAKLFAIAFTAVLFTQGYAQTTTSGALSGAVVDQTGSVIPDAFVEIVDIAKDTTQSATTDHLGAYQFFFVRPGKYSLKVQHAGFREERRLVAIQVGPSTTVNVTLEIASTRSEISVTAEASVIQANSADVSTTVNQKQVSEIPNAGNDLTYIAQTSPGVVMNTDGGGWMAKFSIL